MTQRQVLLKQFSDSFNKCLRNAGTQTGEPNDFTIHLSNTKNIRVYYSPAYKDMVVSFNFGTKSFIINKQMWLVFKKNFLKIDNLLEND